MCMKKNVLFLNPAPQNISKTILAGCERFGIATLTRRGGVTMTSVIEYEEIEIETENSEQRGHRPDVHGQH